MGVFIGVEIPEKVFGEGLIIHHNGSIVVNGSSKVEKIVNFTEIIVLAMLVSQIR